MLDDRVEPDLSCNGIHIEIFWYKQIQQIGKDIAYVRPRLMVTNSA